MAIGKRPLRDSLYHYHCEFDAVNVIAHFTRDDLQPTAGVLTNFIGTRIKPQIHPEVLEKLAGKLEGPPDPGNWHADIAEWAAALRSVRQAKGTYRIVELGCGWGCWLVNMGVAARQSGLAVDLIGVEGNHLHLGNADQTLRMNGFGDSEFTLLHGIAAPREGKALFPNPDTKNSVWNGEAVFYPDAKTLKRAEADRDVQVLDCYPLSRLGEGAVIDLLHIDIQGAEVEYMRGISGGGEHLRQTCADRHPQPQHRRRVDGPVPRRRLEDGDGASCTDPPAPRRTHDQDRRSADVGEPHFLNLSGAEITRQASF